MKLSIVTTLYNSMAYLEEFCRCTIEAAKKLTDDYELILVNDGSPDNALDMALSLHKNNAHIKVIDLSRNFGEHKARMTGLSHSTGDYIFLIQCDLEVDPLCLQYFWNAINVSENIDMVYGVQEKRRGNWWEHLRGLLFYSIFNFLADTKIQSNGVATWLMSRRFANALLTHQERTIFFSGLCTLTGFTQRPCNVTKTRINKSSYSHSKNIKMAIDALTSFSCVPLMLIFYLGSLLSLLAVLYIIFILIQKQFLGVGVSGWTSVIISIWLFGSMIMASIGLMGIYLSRIFLEVKQRPYTIIRETYGINLGQV